MGKAHLALKILDLRRLVVGNLLQESHLPVIVADSRFTVGIRAIASNLASVNFDDVTKSGSGTTLRTSAVRRDPSVRAIKVEIMTTLVDSQLAIELHDFKADTALVGHGVGTRTRHYFVGTVSRNL